jgi:hypothetical protein
VGATVQEFFRPAREEAEAEAARLAAMPAATGGGDVVQALIAEAKAAEAEAAVMPGRQAAVSIVGAEPAPLRPPPPAPKGGVNVAAVVAAVVVVLALAALAWTRLHG